MKNSSQLRLSFDVAHVLKMAIVDSVGIAIGVVVLW
jgi:hypothetical protein